MKPGLGCVPSQNGTVRRYQEVEAATGTSGGFIFPVQVKNISTVSTATLKRPQHHHLGNHQERSEGCVRDIRTEKLPEQKIDILSILSRSVISQLFSNVF